MYISARKVYNVYNEVVLRKGGGRQMNLISLLLNKGLSALRPSDFIYERRDKSILLRDFIRAILLVFHLSLI